MPTVYEYELEFVVKTRATGKTESRMTTEFAYTIMDALHQASMTVDTTTEEITKFIKIGPPKKLIDSVARETQEMIQSALRRFENLCPGCGSPRPDVFDKPGCVNPFHFTNRR